MPTLNVPGAPAEVVASLDRFTGELKAAAGDCLTALILYGGLARGRYQPGKSDINLVVVLSESSQQTLDSISIPLQTAWRTLRAEPMVLTASELPRTAAAFPTKFLDIKSHHLLLCGKDLFLELDVAQVQVRQRVAQELRNLILRLRRQYLLANEDHVALASTLSNMTIPLTVALDSLLQLEGIDCADDSPPAVFQQAATKFGLNAAALSSLAKLRSDLGADTGLKPLYHQILDVLAVVAEIAEKKT